MLSLRKTGLLAACSAALLFAGCAQVPERSVGIPIDKNAQVTGCLGEAEISQWIAAYVAKEKFADPPVDLSEPDAICTRAAFQAKLVGPSTRSLPRPPRRQDLKANRSCRHR